MKNEYDLLKVFATLLVVLGHITILYTGHGAIEGIPVIPTCIKVTDIIYLFHMPLFIAISGAIFAYGIDHGKYQKFYPFLKTKAKRILIPFAFTGICALMPTLVLTGLTQNNPSECLLSILIGTEDVRHLWYLGAIFWCFVAVWCLERFRISLLLSLPISLIIVVSYQNLISSNLFQIANGLGALPSFLCGMWIMREQQHKGFYRSIVAFVSIVVLKMIISFSPFPIVVQASCILLPLPIIYLLVSLSRWIFRFFADSKACKFILKNSFAIYLFHVECIYWFYSLVKGDYFQMFAAFIISISISILLAYIIRKISIQFLIGE